MASTAVGRPARSAAARAGEGGPDRRRWRNGRSQRSTTNPAALNASAAATRSGARQFPPAPCVSTRPRSAAAFGRCRKPRTSLSANDVTLAIQLNTAPREPEAKDRLAPVAAMHRVLIDSHRTVPRRCFGLWTRRGAMALDLLIKNGTVVDGSGMPRYRADIGVRAGRIVEIGRIRSGAEKVIDADGLIVAPGFIAGPTPMDAQIAWDPLGSCSCWHGVTSVVMGNCGFALAPCKPEDREWFARCLTAVEDIPTESMMAGIDWTWETFPEYLATVERLPKAINYGAYIGHSALRMYVMGKRALSEPATEDDLTRMAAAVQEAIRVGAMGFSSSRATTHVTPDATPVASRIAAWSEVDRLVGAMAELNAGVFQVGPDTSGGDAQRKFLARLKQVAAETGPPVMFGTTSTRQADRPN